MKPTDEPSIFRLNRRAFLGRYAGALGTLALAHLLDQDDRRGAARGAAAADVERPAALRIRQSPGEVGDLPVPARRAEPDGPVRPQARADEAPRQAVSRQARRSTSTRRRATLLASPFKFRRTGKSGIELSRAAAAHRRDRRRHHAGPLDDDRVGRSRGGAAADPHRQDPRRPADLGLVGALRPGHREPGTCRPTSCCPTPAACRSTACATGRAAGCRPSTRGRRSAPAATPVAQPRDAPRASRPRPATDQLRLPRRAEPRPPGPPSRQHRARGADRQLRDRRRRCRRPSPRCSTCRSETAGDPAAVRPRQPGHAASTARAACSPAGWSSGACGSCRSS